MIEPTLRDPEAIGSPSAPQEFEAPAFNRLRVEYPYIS